MTGMALTVPAAVSRRPLPAWEYRDYLGWTEQGDGKLAYGIYVQNGRLKGACLWRFQMLGQGWMLERQGARKQGCNDSVVEKLAYEAGIMNLHICVSLQARNEDCFWFVCNAYSEMGVAHFIAHLFLSAY